MNENPYQILDIAEGSDAQTARKAYLKLAKQYHPDRNKGDEASTEKFQKIQWAYDQIVQGKAGRHTLYTEEVQKSRRKPPPPHAYRASRPKEYSSKAKRQAWFFVVFFVVLVISIPLGIAIMSSSYHFKRGEEAYAEGRYAEALDAYTKALDLSGSRESELYLKIAKIYWYRFKSPQYAHQALKEGFPKDQDSEFLLDYHYLLALCEKSVGEYALSLEHLQQALNRAPKGDSLYQIRSNLYFEQLNDKDKALEDVVNAIDLNPSESIYYFNLGKIQFHRKQYKESVEALQNYERKGGEADKEYYFLKGRAFLELGQLEDACPNLTQAYIRGEEKARDYVLSHCQKSG